MRLINRVLDFYIDSSIHVALAVVSLSWITLLEFEVSFDKNVLCFIFFATVTGYNFVKYFGMARFHHRSLANWLKLIQIFSFSCFIGLCYFGYQLNPKTLIYVFCAAIITFLYAIPFLPKQMVINNEQNLRGIRGLKIYVIALVWVCVTVVIPLINNNYQINIDVIITAIQRFLFVIVLMFPFEIRDMRFDDLKLSTIPQRIGIKKTKGIGLLLLVGFFFLEYFKDEIKFKNIIILMVITFITLLCLVFAEEKRAKYYSSFWVEGLPILWLLFLLF